MHFIPKSFTPTSIKVMQFIYGALSVIITTILIYGVAIDDINLLWADLIITAVVVIGGMLFSYLYDYFHFPQTQTTENDRYNYI